jgi:hypothetical protein
VSDPRRAAEQFIALLRGDIHQRQLLRIDGVVDPDEVAAAADAALALFLKAYPPPAAGPARV